MVSEAVRAFVNGFCLPVFDALRPVVGGFPAFVVSISAPMFVLVLLAAMADYADRRRSERTAAGFRS